MRYQTPSARRAFRGRAGFTIVEILIATALSAIVMAGLCAAVHATVQTATADTAMLDASGKARLALGQIERSVRKADAVVQTSPTRLDTVDDSGNATAYVYDAATQRLNYIIGTGATATTVVLARNVTAMTFVAESEADPDTQVQRIVHLTTSLTVTADGESHTFTTSVAPRKARVYQ